MNSRPADAPASTDGFAANVEEHIARWRSYVQRQPAISEDDADELEDNLRSQIDDLGRLGLAPEEAFLVAVRRVGQLDEVSHEYAREHADRLWGQLVLAAAKDSSQRSWLRAELPAVLLLAAGAGLAARMPSLLGAPDNWTAVVITLFVAPFMVGYFAWRRHLGVGTVVVLLGAMAAVGFLVTVYPFVPGGATQILCAMAVPVLAWTVVGISYLGRRRGIVDARMDLVRFSGEWFIYYALIAAGGGVLMGLAMAAFELLGLNPEPAITSWILPLGAGGAAVIAAALVEAKQRVIENMAPVLAAIFTPLTAVLLAAVLIAAVATGAGTGTGGREFLILLDAVLTLVVLLLLYSISARDAGQRAGLSDWLQVILIALALALDMLMGQAMITRIAEFGVSPNKVAALGLNLILLVNLIWALRLGLRFVRGTGTFAAIERWQVVYLPVLPAWALVIVVVFPPLFGFA